MERRGNSRDIFFAKIVNRARHADRKAPQCRASVTTATFKVLPPRAKRQTSHCPRRVVSLFPPPPISLNRIRRNRLHARKPANVSDMRPRNFDRVFPDLAFRTHRDFEFGAPPFPLAFAGRFHFSTSWGWLRKKLVAGGSPPYKEFPRAGEGGTKRSPAAPLCFVAFFAKRRACQPIDPSPRRTTQSSCGSESPSKTRLLSAQALTDNAEPPFEPATLFLLTFYSPSRPPRRSFPNGRFGQSRTA